MRSLCERLVSAVALFILFPLLLLVLLAVRLESSGPGFFRQVRVGRHRRPFICYKVRTMAQGTPEAGTHEVAASAVTRVGRFLRTTKLDELPQLINVARGEMAFVGPRPCLPSQVELVEARDRLGIFEVLPGITGLGQVRGIDMSDPDRLARCDGEYVSARNLRLDLSILWATFRGAGGGDRVKSA
jgi:O-antigen biosynthesis protein WbqP